MSGIEMPSSPKIEVADKRAIVVAGVNYPRRSQANERPRSGKVANRTYWVLAQRYVEWAFKNGLTRVIVFDFLEGKVVEFLKGSASEKVGAVVAPKRMPLLDENYRGWRKVDGKWHLVSKVTSKESMAYWTGLQAFAAAGAFTKGQDIPFDAYWVRHLDWAKQEDSLSVRDVYIGIITSPAKSLHGLHFFGHALTGGPIIVNTWASHGQLGYTELKKTFDKDCRVADLTGSIPLSQGFREAFADDATIGVWGCDSDDHFKADVLVPAMESWSKSKSISSALREQIETARKSTYAAALAKHLQKPVHAALPGTYASHDGADKDDGAAGTSFVPQLMHVNFADCSRILRLYKEALGIRFADSGLYKGLATFGRGYGTYLP